MTETNDCIHGYAAHERRHCVHCTYADEIADRDAEIKRLKERLDTAESLMSDAHDILDDVHCYDTDTYRAISHYFDGGDCDDESTEATEN